MNRKYSKQKPKKITKSRYFVYGGPKVDFSQTINSLDPLKSPKSNTWSTKSNTLSTKDAMEIASGTLNSFASGLNALAEKNHQNWLQEQQNQEFDNELMALGREQAQQNQLALQQAKDFRIQQQRELSEQMQNNQIANQTLWQPNKFMIGGLISAGMAVDSAAGKLIGGEYQSGVGNALSALPGGGLIGGAINRLFGMKTNQAELNRVKQDRAALANAAASASVATSFDDSSLSGPMAVNTNVNAYEGGVFSKGKAARKNAELQQKLLTAQDYAERTAQSSIANIQQSQDDMLASTFAAYGGKLGGFYGNSNKFDDGGPIFNPFTREWTGYDGKPLKRKHDKSFGYTVYTDDGFAVNYNHKGREIGRKKGTQTPSITGKTRNIQEQKYFDRNQELSDSVKVISKRYGVNPNLVASRIGREIVDTAIEHYNDTGGKEFLTNQDQWAVGPTWGLDDTYSRIQSGDVKIKEPWVKLEKQRFTNEHGRKTESVYGRKWSDMVSATAAELAARREVIKKKFPNMTDKQLDAAASASFNMGESGAIKAIKKRGASAVSKYTPFIELKAQGGPLNTHGGSFTNGLTFINNGGTHEANPYEGVPMGVDSQGVPNLVEEGEVIFNDYVFSNRLKVPKDMKKKYKLGTKSSLSFADAAMKLAKESEERPNDPISQAGLEALLDDLRSSQEDVRTRKQAAQARAQFNSLSPEEQMGIMTMAQQEDMQGLSSVQPNKFDGISGPSTIDTPTIKFRVQGKDTDKWTEYSSEEDLIKAMPNFNSSDYIKDTVGGITNYRYRTPNRIVLRGKDGKPLGEHEDITAAIKAGVNFSKYGAAQVGDGVEAYYLLEDPKKAPDFSFKNWKDNWDINLLRSAPILGNLTGLGMSIFSKPDESHADAILNAAQKASTIEPIKFNPVGNYLTYNPFDIEFAANQANAESAAARRALLNTSGGNRAQAMAGILSADQNALNQLGILRRGAAEDNLKQRQLVEDFNRATNMFNSEGQFKAAAANQEARMQAAQMYLNGVANSEELRQKAKLNRQNAIQSNMSGLVNSLANLGQEQVANAQLNWLLEKGYVPGHTKAHGGKLKKKKSKKGLTY